MLQRFICCDYFDFSDGNTNNQPIRRHRLALTGILAVAGLALGFADRASAQPPAVPLNWTGFYVGLNAGVGGGVARPWFDLSSPPAKFWSGDSYIDNQSHRLGGGFAGGQAGYNYQFHNNVVLGIESDLQWSEIRAVRREDTAYMFGIGSGFPITGTTATEMKIGQNWFGTTRLRLGYQFADRFLAYATGGLAYSQFSAGNWGIGISGSPFPGVYSLTNGAATLTRFGWAAGAGVEYALNNHLSIKSEYLYSEYAGVTAPYLLTDESTPPTTRGTFSTGTLGIHLVRAGLNYKLGDTGQTSDIRRLNLEPTWGPAWGGFYVGVNGGYGVGVAKPELSETSLSQAIRAEGIVFSETDTSDMTTKMRSSGFLAGGQFGYNRQLPNKFVAGIETDLQWSGIRAARESNIVGTYAPRPAGFSSNSSLAVSQNWFGSTRLRLGYQPFDRVLVYGTGGVAYSGFSTGISGASTDNLFVFPDNKTTSGSGSSTKFGWTVGAGVEYAMTEHLSFKTEYLYSQYSGFSVPYQRLDQRITPAENDIEITSGTLSTGTLGIHAVRAGLNWKLGDPGH
jgi:outer membrane immunogenic protein